MTPSLLVSLNLPLVTVSHSTQLFLDLMCKDTQLGYEIARNAKVRMFQKRLENNIFHLKTVFRFHWRCLD